MTTATLAALCLVGWTLAIALTLLLLHAADAARDAIERIERERDLADATSDVFIAAALNTTKGQ